MSGSQIWALCRITEHAVLVYTTHAAIVEVRIPETI
jgi:hypothetical protein